MLPSSDLMVLVRIDFWQIRTRKINLKHFPHSASTLYSSWISSSLIIFLCWSNRPCFTWGLISLCIFLKHQCFLITKFFQGSWEQEEKLSWCTCNYYLFSVCVISSVFEIFHDCSHIVSVYLSIFAVSGLFLLWVIWYVKL